MVHKYYNINLAISVGKRKTSLTQDACYCVVMIVLSFFSSGKKKTHTYTQPMGTNLQRGSLKKNNADPSSSHHGSKGNNKGGCVLCVESELSVVFGVSRDSTAVIRHNKTHVFDEKPPPKKSKNNNKRYTPCQLVEMGVFALIIVIQNSNILNIFAIIPVIVMTLEHVHC